MDTNFERHIPSPEHADKEGGSNKLAKFAGAAAVLALVTAFGQQIMGNSMPDRGDESSEVAQQPKKKEASPERKAYLRIKGNFEEIFGMMDYLQPHGQNQGLAYPKGFTIKRDIKGVNINGKRYDVSTEYLKCGYGAVGPGKCRQSYQGVSPYEAPYRITMNNTVRRVEYTFYDRNITLSVYMHKNPIKDQFHKLLPNNTAYIRFAGYKKPENPFSDELPTSTYRGHNHLIMDQKLQELHDALYPLYAAKKAKDEKVSDEALNGI